MQGDMQGRHCTTIEWKTESHNDVNRQCRPLTCCPPSTASCHERGTREASHSHSIVVGWETSDLLPSDTPATSSDPLAQETLQAQQGCRVAAAVRQNPSRGNLLSKGRRLPMVITKQSVPRFHPDVRLKPWPGWNPTHILVKCYHLSWPLDSHLPALVQLHKHQRFNKERCVWAVVMMARELLVELFGTGYRAGALGLRQ